MNSTKTKTKPKSKVTGSYQQLKNSTTTPQSLIHIDHTTTDNQFKYWFLLLKSYKESYDNGDLELDDKGFFYTPISYLNMHMGYQIPIRQLEADLMTIRSQPVILNYLNKDKTNVIHGGGYISEWKIVDGKVGVIFPTFVLEILIGDASSKKMFLQMKWDIFVSFSGKYESIIYKLCKDYEGVGRTPRMAIDQFRGYIGLKSEEYPEFKELNRRIISSSVKAINSNALCDIQISAEIHRENRKAQSIQFVITPIQKISDSNELALLESIADQTAEIAFKDSMIPLSKQRTRRLLITYNIEQIKCIIKRANEYIATLQGDDVNPKAIYNTAFKEGWGISEQELYAINNKEKVQIELELEAIREELPKNADVKSSLNTAIQSRSIEKEIEKAQQNSQAKEWFLSLPSDSQNKIASKIEQRLRAEPNPLFLKMLKDTIKNKGLESLTSHPLIAYVRDIMLESTFYCEPSDNA